MNTIAETKDQSLLKLKQYLNYQLSGTVLYFLSFFTVIFLFLASASAIIFSIFMLKVLYRERKTGWIIFFFILVIIPIFLISLISLWIPAFKPLMLFSIGLFYLYFFFLRFEVNDWVREQNAKAQSELDSDRRQEELKIFMKKFE